MPSLWARLRGHHSRRSSAPVSGTNTHPTPSLPTSVSLPATQPFIDQPPPNANPIGRQIHPDLDSLLDSYSAEADAPHGLKPRRHSVGSHTSSGAAHSAPPSAGLQPPNEEHELATPEQHDNATPARMDRRALSQLSIFGILNTSGSSKEGTPTGDETASLHARSVPDGRRLSLNSPGDKGDTSAAPARHSFDFAPLTPIHTRSVTYRRRTKTEPEPEPETYKASNISFTPHTTPSQRSTRPNRSNTTPSSQSTKSRRSLFLRLGTPVSRILQTGAVDSPGTFGHPTPPGDPDGGYPFTFTPPPMPPLDHPELVAAMASRSNLGDSQSGSGKTSTRSRTSPSTASTLSSRPPRSLSMAGRQNHYGSLPSGQFRVTKSIRPYASLPKVQQIFGQTQGQPETEPSNFTRFRSMSDAQPRRRRSAAALFDHATLRDDDDSRNMIVENEEDKDTASSPPIDASDPAGGSTGPPADDRTRGDNVPSAIQPAASSPRPLSFPSVISSSSALGSPFLLQGSDVDHNLSQARIGQLTEGAVQTANADGTGMQRNSMGAPVSPAMVARANSSQGKKPNGTPSPPKTPLLAPSTSAATVAGPSSLSLLRPPVVSITAPTPEASPGGISPSRRSVSDSLGVRAPGTLASPRSFGKRKAEDVEVMSAVPKHVHHTSFVLPPDRIGRSASRHSSETSRAPSAFHTPKRARLSSSGESPSPSRVPKGSWSSHTSSKIPTASLFRAGSSTRSASVNANGNDVDRRRSLSQASIPMSAIVTPHVPSVSRSSNFHMRDPRRPPKIQSTPWSLRFRSQEEDGSPVHAWCFFIGFILFPLWWVASFLPIPRTREVGGTDTEKAVTLDDPQIEHDARSWRLRCRVMAAVSFLTYVPFIVLVAVFVSPRA